MKNQYLLSSLLTLFLLWHDVSFITNDMVIEDDWLHLCTFPNHFGES